MSPKLIRSPRVIKLDVIHGAIVIAPRYRAADVFNLIREQLASVQVFEHQVIVLIAFLICAIRQNIMVRRHIIGSHTHELFAFGQVIHVQHNLLVSFLQFMLGSNQWFPAIDRVRFACFRARIIQIVVSLCRHCAVVLHDASQYLFVQHLLQMLGVLHFGVSVRVFRLEVRDCFGTLFVAKPCIIVHRGVPWQSRVGCLLFCDGWLNAVGGGRVFVRVDIVASMRGGLLVGNGVFCGSHRFF
mmetsp:Transcript_24249/g.38419  ORF Transcript_24249/g.38419 Transcript_24249/m.38419 type:complete len:242 (+) Transcript_24249:38-763(+)